MATVSSHLEETVNPKALFTLLHANFAEKIMFTSEKQSQILANVSMEIAANFAGLLINTKENCGIGDR